MNSYNVIGKYVDDTNTILDYAVRNLNSGNIERVSKETFSFLVGRKQIKNCIGTLTNGKVVFSGVDCNLNDLPSKKITDKFEEKGKVVNMPNPKMYRSKSALREDICKLVGQTDEIALYQFFVDMTYNRNIQFICKPNIEKVRDLTEEEVSKGHRNKISFKIVIPKLNIGYCVEVISILNSKVKCGREYLLNLYTFNYDLIYTVSIEASTTTTSPITSIVSTSKNVPIIHIVEPKYTSKRLMEKFKEFVGI